MMIPVYDYCLPDKECVATTDDPCELFRKIKFPVNEFFPPRLAEMIARNLLLTNPADGNIFRILQNSTTFFSLICYTAPVRFTQPDFSHYALGVSHTPGGSPFICKIGVLRKRGRCAKIVSQCNKGGFAMKGVLFGRHIEPACEYCELGRPTRDGQMILCEKNGAVSPSLFLPEICLCAT